MANREHVKLVKRGATEIADWRKANPDVQLRLSGADLSGVKLSSANLRDADLSRADLTKVNLNQASLRRADLEDANLTDAELCETNFNQAELIRANLYGADLRRAFLAKAELSHSTLFEADLREADLRMAVLSYSNFTDADLTGADLAGALIYDTIFSGTNLNGARFTRAHFSNANLSNIDLSSVNGLTDVFHEGPSSLGSDTLYRSQGNIPELFLRGCGVPNALITFLPSLLGAMEPLQFYSCFISYSHKDEQFCQRLHSRMSDAQLRVWYAPEDMQGGKKIHEQIDHAIRLHDKLLLVLSEDSMKSEWVATEIFKARKREIKEGRQVLFPIRLVPFEMIQQWEKFDADTGKDMAREIREYFTPDFSNWKDHDIFEEAFTRLLTNLQASGAKS